MIIRDATASDFAELLRLNEESVHFLSPLSPARLEALFDEAAYCRVAADGDAVCGFLLALGEGSRYDSPNYLWFAGRFDRFLDIEPPNEASRRFHQRYGFNELGTQSVAGGKKRVSLQAVSLPDEPLSSTLTSMCVG